MEFLNIGFLELIFILGLAIVVLGPQRTAELTGELGRLMARLRRNMNLLRDEFTQRMEEETREVRGVGETLKDPLRDDRQRASEAEASQSGKEDSGQENPVP